MELSPLLIYFIGQIKSFSSSFAIIVFIGGITLAIFNIIKAVAYCDADSTYELKAYERIKLITNKINKVLGPIVSFCFLGLVLIPSRSTVAAMIVIPAFTNNAQVQNISQGALRWAEEYIKNQLELEVQKATKVK